MFRFYKCHILERYSDGFMMVWCTSVLFFC